MARPEMDLKKLIEDGDADAITKYFEEKAQADAAGLKAKNDELLGKLKKASEKTDSLQSQIDELKDVSDAAAAKVAEEAGNVDKVKEALEVKFDKERKKLQDELEAERGVNRKLLVDNGLSDALTSAGVKPEYASAVRALIQNDHEIDLVDLDGQRTAQIKGASLKDFVAGWAQTDQGKAFVAAPDNTGGGAKGDGGGAPEGKTISREAFDRLSPREKSQKIKEGVKPTE